MTIGILMGSFLLPSNLGQRSKWIDQKSLYSRKSDTLRVAMDQASSSEFINYPILDIIPQRPPVVCVDRLLHVSNDEATSSFLIASDFLFVRDGKITSSGLLENVAQTAAAKAGYENKANNIPVQRGFIAAFKNVVVHKLPEINSEIQTKIITQASVMNISTVNATIHLNDELILTCEIRIVLEE